MNIALHITTGCFDVIVTNPLNAIFQGNTIGEELELIYNDKIINLLKEHYHAVDNNDVLAKCANDWRYCIPEDIAVDGFVPRTPYVKLLNDDHWKPLNEIESRLDNIVKTKRQQKSSRKR